MPPKRQTPFQKQHVLEFALKIDSRSDDGTVTSVVCQLCEYCGREEDSLTDASRKHKRTDRTKLFQPPFRPESYRKHHEMQHPSEWAAYKALTDMQKIKYFDNKLSRSNTLHNYMDLSSTTLTFKLQASIVEQVLGNLFFKAADGASDDEGDDNDDGIIQTLEDQRLRALRSFQQQPDGSYTSTIKNVTRFQLATDFMAIGMTFRQITAAIGRAQVRTMNAKLVGIWEYMVGGFTRTLVGVGWQVLSGIL